MADARTGAGEAARWLMQGVTAIEDYVAEIAPAFARKTGGRPPPPVTGETLLQTPAKRSKFGTFSAVAKHADEIHDVTESASTEAQNLIDLSRLPDRGPTVAEVVWPVDHTSVIRAAHDSGSVGDAVSAVVMAVVWGLAAVEIIVGKLRRRVRGSASG